MHVDFYAPLPPANTGVADYAAALLGEMRKLGSVEPNSNKGVPLYHLGNNHLHREIYRRALERPGVAVLHDAVLNHFFLGTLNRDAYIEEFVYNYGEWMRELGEDLWKQRAGSAADPRYFEYPMLKRVATASRAIIVHNRAAARAVVRHAPEAEVIEIPHLFSPPELPDLVDTLRFRNELGLRPRTMLAGVFGHLRESKRLPVILRAMERVDGKLLVAGAFASTDLERAMTPLLEHPKVIQRGYLSERDFWRYAAATDVCINLRYPTASETSGIAVRMMGIGKPVVFTNGLEIARIPENACLRVDVGACEEEMLTANLLWLSRDREAAAEIGQRAAEHIKDNHALARIAKLYWENLKTFHAKTPSSPRSD